MAIEIDPGRRRSRSAPSLLGLGVGLAPADDRRTGARVMRDKFTLYWDGEEPQIGDVVWLGGSVGAAYWTVKAIRARGDYLTLRRGKARRYNAYTSHYKLIRRAALKA
jgi:hypothetical protein